MVCPRAAEETLSVMAAKLSMPKVGLARNGPSLLEGFTYETTYENFARRVERQNSDTEFTKDLMDAAFQNAVKKWSGQVHVKGKLDEVIFRVSHPRQRASCSDLVAYSEHRA
jgi:hypothetical protein